jgi:hypothetical protein
MNGTGGSLSSVWPNWEEPGRLLNGALDDAMRRLVAAAAAVCDLQLLADRLYRALAGPLTHDITANTRRILCNPRGIAFTHAGERMYVMHLNRKGVARIECYERNAATGRHEYAESSSFSVPKTSGVKKQSAVIAPASGFIRGVVCLTSHADRVYYCAQDRPTVCMRAADGAITTVVVPDIAYDLPAYIAVHAPSDTSSTLAISVASASGQGRVVVANWDTRTGSVHNVTSHSVGARSASAPAGGVAFDGDGALYAVAAGQIFVLDPTQGTFSPLLQLPDKGPHVPAGIVFFRRRMAVIAYAGSDHVAYVNVETGDVKSGVVDHCTLTGHVAVLSSCAVYATTLDAHAPVVEVPLAPDSPD